MAYSHSKYEVEMTPLTPSTAPAAGANGVNIAATGVQSIWAPGLVPHIIRAVGVMQTAGTPNDGAVHLSFRADLTTPGTVTEILKVVLPTTVTGNKVVYKTATRYIEVKPGQIVQCAVTAAATAASLAKVILYVEPRWEQPGNLTGMLSTT